jgi:hypothetical protein
VLANKLSLRTKRRTVASSGRETLKIVLPSELASLLRLAARRRSALSGGRIEVSELVLEFLERHRAEIEAEAKSPMRV